MSKQTPKQHRDNHKCNKKHEKEKVIYDECNIEMLYSTDEEKSEFVSDNFEQIKKLYCKL